MIGTILQAFTNEVITGTKKRGKFTDTQLEEEKTNEDAHCATFQVENQVTLNEKKNKRRPIVEIINKRKINYDIFFYIDLVLIPEIIVNYEFLDITKR